MIKINFALTGLESEEDGEYTDSSTFDAFAGQVYQMINAGLHPVKFIGQASPYLVHFSWDQMLDQYGNKYSFEKDQWGKVGKEKSMEELQKLPEYVPHPKNPKMKVKVMKIFPATVGMPKSVEELVSQFEDVSEDFEQVEIASYQPKGDIWTGPSSNPQALAYFTGKKNSKFALYVGSDGYNYNPNLEEIALHKIGHHITPVTLGLMIKTNYGDTYVTEKKGNTLMSVAQYIGPLGKVISATVAHDIQIYVPAETSFTDIPLIKSILTTGIPDQKEKQKYISKTSSSPALRFCS